MKDFKKSVVYQIYPKSFFDTNADGLGDLNGVTAKLDYLKELGVDFIWLTPFYVSPQNDNGYDIADYVNIDPIYGTIENFDQLAKEAEARGIGLMLDLVFNHTSSKHSWFKKALEGQEKYRNYYIFKETKDGEIPTNWISKFGGSVWEKLEGTNEFYLHLFDKTQPDLNWGNEEVRKEIYDVVNFWIKKGVKGFRLDVINLISKPERFEDDFEGDGRRFYTDGPKIHEYLKELNNETFGRFDNLITVGEMSSTDIGNCVKYSNPDEKELSMVFNFHHLKVDYDNGEKWSLKDFDFNELKDIFDKWQNGMQDGNGWSAVFWCNHDQPRIVSRIGNDKEYHTESAKMLATAIHLLRGTPYIYQGEEFGMTNPYYSSIEQYRDVESLNYYKILKNEGVAEDEILRILASKSRDNSRTPMQWDSSTNGGFTKGTPWLSPGLNYKTNNAKIAQEDQNSVFYHYKKLIELRKSHDIIAYGTYETIQKNHAQVFAYQRAYNGERMIVVNNFYGTETKIVLVDYIDQSNVIISNYSDLSVSQNTVLLRPYESFAAIIRENK